MHYRIYFLKTIVVSEKIYIFATAYEQRIELWCNGNTADFGSVVLGSSPGSSTSLEITLVISFFCGCLSNKLNDWEFFLLVQAPQTLSQSLMLRIYHKKNGQAVGTAHGIMGCEDIWAYCSLRCAIWYPRFGFAGRVPAAQLHWR